MEMKTQGDGSRLPRRRLLKSIGGMGVLIAGVASPFSFRARASNRASVAGAKQINGFAVMAPDSPVSAIAGNRKRMPPLVSGPFVPHVDQRLFPSAQDTSRDSGIRLFTFPATGTELRDSGGIVVRNFKGEVFMASVGVERFLASRSTWVPWYSLTAEPGVPQPAPVWEGGSIHSGIREFMPVEFLPCPGIAIQTEGSCVAHWMDEDVRYSLDCRGVRSLTELEALVETLVAV